MQVPDWLSTRGGGLLPGAQGFVTIVTLGGVPQYRLELRPLGGKFGCAVQQAVNARRVDDATATYPTAAAAVAGGLDQLRAALGW